jgi:hypothetical protein
MGLARTVNQPCCPCCNVNQPTTVTQNEAKDFLCSKLLLAKEGHIFYATFFPRVACSFGGVGLFIFLVYKTSRRSTDARVWTFWQIASFFRRSLHVFADRFMFSQIASFFRRSLFFSTAHTTKTTAPLDRLAHDIERSGNNKEILHLDNSRWDFLWVSVGFPLGVGGISHECRWDFPWVSVDFPSSTLLNVQKG